MVRPSTSSTDAVDVRPLDVIRWPGLVGYADGLARQEARHKARLANEVADALFLLQHRPVFSLGRRADHGHILGSPQVLDELGIEVHETGRGGDVTYHGPGQLVGYPIVDLRPERKDVKRYVYDLEQVMIEVCAEYGVSATRVEGLIGCWVDGERKIGAIGVRIAKWTTMHGFAFNVTDEVMRAFQLIVPCGISDRAVTSLAQEIGRQPDWDEVADVVEHQFRLKFGHRPAVGGDAG